MATSLNDNIRLEAGKHLDDRYLNGVTPWASVAAVNAAIVPSRRTRGLTVLIGTEEYWYRHGIADINLILKQSGGAGTGGIGETGMSFWKFDSVTSPGPAAGYFRFDNAVMSSVTKLFISELTDAGEDVLNFLNTISIGDKFYIQQKIDPTKWFEAIVSDLLIDQGTWWEIPVEVEDDSGILMDHDALTIVRIGSGGSGGGGAAGGIAGTGSAVWTFQTAITTPPGTGIVRFDNATIGSVTNVYLHEITNSDEDVSNFLATVKVGDILYIQQVDDATRWLRAFVHGVPVDNGAWWTIPVSIDGSSALPVDETDVVVRFTQTGGQAAQFFTEYFTADGIATIYTLTDPGPLKIMGVYVGGQHMQEGVQYAKNDTARTVTFSFVPPSGTTIDVEYMKGTTPSSMNIWDEGTYGLGIIATQVETNVGIDDTKGITAQKLGNKPEYYDGGAWTSVVNLTVNNRKFKRTIIGAIAYTKAGTYSPDHEGNVRKDFMVANGVNKPTFSSDFVIAWDNWINTINTLNVIRFEYLSNGKIAVDMRNY